MRNDCVRRCVTGRRCGMSSVEDLCDSGTVRRGQCGTVGRVMLDLLCRGCCGGGEGVGGYGVWLLCRGP